MTAGLAACLDSWLLARHWRKLNVSTINSPTNSMRVLMLWNDPVPRSTLNNWPFSSLLTISPFLYPGRSVSLPCCHSLSLTRLLTVHVHRLKLYIFFGCMHNCHITDTLTKTHKARLDCCTADHVLQGCDSVRTNCLYTAPVPQPSIYSLKNQQITNVSHSASLINVHNVNPIGALSWIHLNSFERYI